MSTVLTKLEYTTTQSSAPNLAAPVHAHVKREQEIRDAIAADTDTPADWSWLCAYACEQGRRQEAAMTFRNADSADRVHLRHRLAHRFGIEVLNDLPEPDYSGLKTPWRDTKEYPFRGGGILGIVVSAVFCGVLSSYLGPCGVALGSAAILLHHITILRASLAGNEAPPYPDEFPSFAFGLSVLPIAVPLAFLPMFYAYASMFNVSQEQMFGPFAGIPKRLPYVAIAGGLLAIPGVLIALAWERFHSIDALRPRVFGALFIERPRETSAVLAFYLISLAGGCFLLAISAGSPIYLSIPLGGVAQVLLAMSARRLALLARTDALSTQF